MIPILLFLLFSIILTYSIFISIQFRFIKINLKLILQIERRKMEQILKDQVKNKLTNDQISILSNIMAEGTALNTNVDSENANEQIFLNNLIK